MDAGILDFLPSPDGDAAEASLLLRQRREMLQRALATLTPSERAAVALRDMEGWSTEETAEALGIRAGTVRTQIASGRAKMADFCRRVVHSKGRAARGNGGR